VKLRLTGPDQTFSVKMLLTYSSVTAAFFMVICILFGLSG
jgi:hypothetical protein